MKLAQVSLTVTAFVLTALAIPAQAQDEEPPATESAETAATIAPEEVTPKASYGVGLQMGSSFKYQEFEVDLDELVQGIRDGLAGSQPRYDPGEIQAALEASRSQANAAISARNRALGDAFLAANGRKQGVYSLPSGLQYEVLTAGNGPKPTLDDRVEVSFRSSRLDGTRLDESQGEGRLFEVSNLIPAWQEALPLMPVGSTWRLFVPPALAHGDQGSGRIEPGATTIFDLQLLSIAEPEPAAEGADEGAGEDGDGTG